MNSWQLNRLKIENLTQEVLLGPVYNLLKGTCQSSIKLEYNMEECYTALADRLDWENPECDRCPFTLCKPLPLKGHLGHLTVVAEYFFNNNLEYSKLVSEKMKYTILITKTKTANCTKNVHKKNHYSDACQRCLARCRKLSKEDQSHQTSRIFSQHLYQRTIHSSFDPPRVICEDTRNWKRLMLVDELYKFSDGTLMLVRDKLHYMVLSFIMGYNKGMPIRKWSSTDHRRSKIIVEMINNLLLERRVMRNLKRLVGARELKMDYKLMQRTV
ncbi:hypothetical protein Tco_0671274 [Tanacetum coccineum]